MSDSPKHSEAEILEFLAGEYSYEPTQDQRRVRGSFWSRVESQEILISGMVSLDQARSLVREPRLPTWWKKSGFPEWFSNSNEFRDRLEYLSHRVLDSLEEVLDDRAANASAKVAAAKLLLEAARKMPSKQSDLGKFLDAKIQGMTRPQIEDFLRRNQQQLPPPTETEQ
jgi:hypothetical protein